MATPFDNLQPQLLFRRFEELTRIPRCSGNERQAAEFLLRLAKEKGLEARQDTTGNVVIRVPASQGRESSPVVVLQGHLDMVGEKSADSSHDFNRDPIKVLSDGQYLTAEGTTLGADNGIGLAAALALIDDKNAVHGPLELLFTVDEERGLTGAQGLEPSFIRGRMLLNLDSEEEGAIYVGCAGGADTHIEFPLRRAKTTGEPLRVMVKGLRGGHSGLDINLGRANAIKLMADFLWRLSQKTELGLATIQSGDKHNAIPREALADLWLPAGGRAQAEALLEEMKKEIGVRFGKTDPGIAFELEVPKKTERPLAPKVSATLIDFLLAAPHGPLGMSQEVAGLVETSTNLAVVKLEKSRATIIESSRSSVMPTLRELQRQICALVRLAGGRADPKDGYPGWQPNTDSPLLKRANKVHEQMTGKPAHIKAVHAGLECGIIGEKIGGMDMISFGPQIEWPHSPSERVNIASVGRFYEFMKALLRELAA